MTAGGIFPAIVGTALLVLIMSIAGVPIGTVTAVYLVNTQVLVRSLRVLFGSQSTRWQVFRRSSLVSLASVFLSSLSEVDLTKFSLEGRNCDGLSQNILWASLTMALLTLPVVIVSVEEAIRTVPQDLRAASLALGATKWQNHLARGTPHFPHRDPDRGCLP